MKKILFLLLCTVSIYGQTSTGQEQEFDYGIKNNSTQTITTPTYIGTFGTDGTQGKIPSALIAKTSDIADSLATKENIANKSDSYTVSSSTTYASTKAIVDGLATKQNTLTNPITGTGTTNTISKFTASGTVGNSNITDNGSLVSVMSPQIITDILSANSAALSGSALNINQTWNTTGAPSAILLNVTNTKSATVSKLLDLKVGGSSQFEVFKDGRLQLNNFAVINTNGNSIYLRTNLSSAPGYLLNLESYNTLNGSNNEQGIFNSSEYYSPTTGAGTFSFIRFNGTINQTGGANGVTRGLYISPTITSAADFRAIETTVGNVILGSTSGNVLIGTTVGNGIDRLQVNGSTKTTALTLATAPTTSAGTYDILTRNTSTGVVEKVLSSSVVGGSGTTNYLPKFTGANSLGNSLIYDNGTNVGIGTTSPQVNLSVKGAQNNTIAPANGVAKFIGNDTGIFIGTLAGIPNFGSWLQAMREHDGLVFPMFLNPNGGNVGIGTTTDNGIDRVQVNGTISANAATTSNQVVVKSQLDAKVSLTGNETVAGNKTLSGTTTLNETIIREGYQLKFPKGVMYQSSVGTNALTDNRTVSFPDASGTVALVETVRPYKVYTALLSQLGTSAPTATVLENTLGGTIVWTRSATGIYVGTLSGAFTVDKTFTLMNTGHNVNGFEGISRVDADSVKVQTYINGPTYSDGRLSNSGASIEIRVYN